MKTSGYLLFVFGITLSIPLCQGVTFAYEEEEEKSTVYSLQQEGWEIVKSKTREESLPGLSPYHFLRRVVSVTTYWLQRDKEEIVCQILYDSQLDRQQEECGDRYPIPVNSSS